MIVAERRPAALAFLDRIDDSLHGVSIDVAPHGITARWCHSESPNRSVWFALGILEALGCGRVRVMSREVTPGKRTTRRYSKEEMDQAVRLVFQLGRELGTSQGTVIRIADQLG